MSQIYSQIKPEISAILKKALDSEEITPQEALELLKVTNKEFIALQTAADQLCYEKKENIVTFVINRNINFTNICHQGCKFCAYNVPETHKDAFLLSIEEIKKRVREAKERNCTEVCMQGGINPSLKAEYYFDILKGVKETAPEIHIHAFSPQEIKNISHLSGNGIEDTLKELKRAGLDSIPGTAAEILVDEIRKIICPNKVNVAEWKEIIT